jgi:hypothetical protein
VSRTAHIAYLAALIVLAAMLVRPAGDRDGQNKAEVLDLPTDSLSMLATFEPLAQAQDAGKAANEADLDLLENRGASEMKGRTAASNQELIKRALEVAREIDSELGGRLANLHEKNSAAFERVMRNANVGKNLFAMAHLKQRDPDLYQIKLSEMKQTVSVNRAAAQLREAIRTKSAGQVTTLTNQLRTQLQIQLAMRIKNRGDYICRIEEQLTHAREELDREAGNFQQTVEAQLAALSRLPEGEQSEEDELNSQLNSIKASE